MIDDVDSEDQEMQDLEDKRPQVSRNNLSKGRSKDVEMHDDIEDVDSDKEQQVQQQTKPKIPALAIPQTNAPPKIGGIPLNLGAMNQPEK